MQIRLTSLNLVNLHRKIKIQSIFLINCAC